MSKYPMPVLNFAAAKLEQDELAIARRIINRDGTLRASKPNVQRPRVALEGEAAYLWRMVAFAVSPVPAHHCMPVMAFCDLPQDDYAARHREMKRLDAIADAIVKTVPVGQWHGVARWAGVLG